MRGQVSPNHLHALKLFFSNQVRARSRASLGPPHAARQYLYAHVQRRSDGVVRRARPRTAL